MDFFTYNKIHFIKFIPCLSNPHVSYKYLYIYLFLYENIFLCTYIAIYDASIVHKDDILDHRTQKANPNGRTPTVDGEAFDMVRSYTLRRSTVRILSKIKAIHDDDNVYLNTIVDEAIRYYYEYLKNNLKE